MPTRPKIKIQDNAALRQKLDALYVEAGQVCLAKWAIAVAKHIFAQTGIAWEEYPEVVEGFAVNEEWQQGRARMHDVREAGFKMHALARTRESEIEKNAFRTAGQAVASGHMREHAMVSADYAIRTINLLHPGSDEAVKRERTWQLAALEDCLKT